MEGIVRENHFIMINRSINQEDITILDVYAPDNRATQYMKVKLTELNGKIDKPTIFVDFNTLLSLNNKTYTQTFRKDI